VHIVNLDGRSDGVIAKVISLAVGESRFYPITGQPTDEVVAVVIASGIGIQYALRERRAAEFAPLHHERVFQKPALFEIGDQSGGRLIYSFAVRGCICAIFVWWCQPTCMIEIKRTSRSARCLASRQFRATEWRFQRSAASHPLLLGILFVPKPNRQN
jgi:hypothetical protein